MAASASSKRAMAKYSAAKTKNVGLHLVISSDADILAKLDSVPNKQGYIKDLIRADIARSAQNGQEGGSASLNE